MEEAYICSKCKIEKPLSAFYKYKKCIRGYRDKCIECYKDYYIENKDDIITKMNLRKDANKKTKALRYSKNKKIINRKSTEYAINRDKIDPLFRLRHNMRTAIRDCFIRNGYRKDSKTSELLGCTFNQFKLYIESKFEHWMTWENRGKYNGQFYYGWDIDHIMPISSANTIDDVHKLSHYTNFQPLCSHINRDIKKDKISYVHN